MTALVSSRLLLIVGESVPLRKLSKVPSFHGSVRFLSRVAQDEGPLTLASLGFRSEFKTTRKSKISKPNHLNRPVEAPKSKERVVKSSGVKAVQARKSLEIEAAPFAAESFSELGLPPLLIERLGREGFMVPTDVQSAAIPTILKNHDIVIQSYTGSRKTLAYLLPILSEVGPLKRRLPDGDEEIARKPDIEAVIVAPSRELGMQIVREVEKLLGPEDKKMVQQLVGGANRSRQEEALRKNKTAIVVGTPAGFAISLDSAEISPSQLGIGGRRYEIYHRYIF